MSLLQKSLAVIPAKAGIQSFQDVLDPGFRRGAGFVEFCKSLLYVLNQLADRLGIVKALGNNRMGMLALFLVLARVAHQGSRLSAVRWAQNHCVPEILGLSDFDKRDLYRALDWVAQHQDRIENSPCRTMESAFRAPGVLEVLGGGGPGEGPISRRSFPP